jgi:flagellar biogenesis protein FliO
MVSTRGVGKAGLLGVFLVCSPGLHAQPQPPPAAAAPAAPAAPSAPAPASKEEPPLGFEPEELKGVEGGAADGLAGAWAMMVKAMVGLAAVLLLIYLVLGKGLARLSQKQNVSRAMRVVDRLGLDPKKTLYLVDVDGVRTLVGISETAMSMMVLPEPPPAQGQPDPASSTGAQAFPKGDA